MKNFIKFLSLVGFGLALSCATFREGNVEYQKIEATNAAKKSISFAVTGQVKLNTNEPVPQNANALGSWANVVKEEFTASSLFSAVKNNEKSTDLSVDINIQNNGQFSQGLSMLTGLTLYLFPSSATDEFVVEATFKNKSGKEIAKIQKRDSVSTWSHITLIFVFPFKSLSNEVYQCQKDLINSVLVEANAKGVLK
ncbi:hypothetical protein LEP1GSC195_0109 [Leptospira wolbachii serovar Codice str. CDC]|uniref:Lipoprotein n=1 Tax=Leptospira wolbachii serovar Codice str. CDC TaxID=1218599 RepID=R9AC39_9LEPT|nr:hypothetical protein [Leptospira wolbachii]EOQ97750.1 hypothetical protein LEP1GSC195_0109 [Leptospira wolbachii serovar Codice str. CDC]